MPELPEVETVVRELKRVLKNKPALTGFKAFRKNLRYDIPQKELQRLVDSKENHVLEVSRRAKYILLSFENTVVISHLGMTGAWRVEKAEVFKAPSVKKQTKRPHDHLVLFFEPDLALVYEDPRRFGFIKLCPKNKLDDVFRHLGFEPLDVAKKQLDELFVKLKKSNKPIKNLIMDQNFIVGVGNIYACEALFRARINPFKRASLLTFEQFESLIHEIQIILKAAIKTGGSSVKNYRKVDESSGNFQKQHFVYGKAGELCPHCKSKFIERKVQAGRSTFFCSACQR